MSVNAVIHMLEDRHLDFNAYVFKYYLMSQGLSGHIKAGEYEITNTLTLLDFINHLVRGQVVQYSLTLIEGQRWQQLVKEVISDKHLRHVLTSPMTESHLISQLGVRHIHALAGQFFPSTYYYTHDQSDLELLKRAFNLRQKHLNTAWRNRDPRVMYKNSYQALIVASLIVGESGYRPEYSHIAAVIHHRLKRHMPLQVDASVRFGLNKWSRKLSHADLKRGNVYNTYLNYGLPPTPIACPGDAAIEAALHPLIATEDLYFVHKPGTNHHVFSKNLAQHHRAVDRYHQSRRR